MGKAKTDDDSKAMVLAQATLEEQLYEEACRELGKVKRTEDRGICTRTRLLYYTSLKSAGATFAASVAYTHPYHQRTSHPSP